MTYKKVGHSNFDINTAEGCNIYHLPLNQYPFQKNMPSCQENDTYCHVQELFKYTLKQCANM